MGFGRRPRVEPKLARSPRVSILKPLAGNDDELAKNLESFANLDYPNFQLLLAVASPARAGGGALGLRGLDRPPPAAVSRGPRRRAPPTGCGPRLEPRGGHGRTDDRRRDREPEPRGDPPALPGLPEGPHPP